MPTTSLTPPVAPPRTTLPGLPVAPPTSGTSSSGSLPPPITPPIASSVPPIQQTSLRLKIARWMERTFGRSYLPIAMLAGGAVGGTVGALSLGPVGGIAGGIGGALLAGSLVFSG